MKKASCVALLATSLAHVAHANIFFANIPATAMYNPGDSIKLAWVYNATTVPTDNNPIDLYLRADSGQNYPLAKGVNQQLLTYTITIPSDATGGQHRVEADYVIEKQAKSEMSNRFNITGEIRTTTRPPTATSTSTDDQSPSGSPNGDGSKPEGSGGGLSAGALAGIIGGVIVLLLVVALIFACRYRRRNREAAAESRGMDDKNSRPIRDYTSKDQDKEVLTMAPVHNEPATPPGAKREPYDQFPPFPPPMQQQQQQPPQQQQQQQQQQFQNMHGGAPPTESLGGRSPRMMNQPPHQGPMNPFESEQEQRQQQQQSRMPPPNQGVSPRTSPRMPHHQYEPPALPPHLQQQQQHQNQHALGRPGPGMAPPSQSPFSDQNGRRSFESEVESVYDPTRVRSPGPNGPYPGSPARSGSGRQLNNGSSMGSPSDRMPHDPRQLHQARSQQDLRAEAQSHEERQALAAAVAAAASSPTQAPRQPYSPQMHQRQLQRTDSGRLREIEMQPLEIQQHHLAQQQKVQERQQRAQSPLVPHQKPFAPGQVLNVQQQQQTQSPTLPSQQHAPVIPSPLANNAPVPPAPQPQQAPQPGSQTQPKFDPTQYDDKAEIIDDDEEGRQPYNGYRDTIFGAYADVRADSEDETGDDDSRGGVPIVPPAIANQSALQGQQQQKAKVAAADEPVEGAQVQRKKSVKFTGVPITGPIVLSGPEAAAQHQAQRQQRLNEQQQQQKLHHSDEDEEDDYSDEDDEDDIKIRMMQTETGSSPNVTHPSPYQNSQLSPSLDNVAAFGSEDGFYEDVLAAVEKTVPPPVTPAPDSSSSSTTLPPPSSSASAPAPPKQTSQPLTPAPSVPMPPVPGASFMPPPPPVHESFGAPSPRMTPRPPASATPSPTSYQDGPRHGDGGAGYPPPPTSPKNQQAFPQPPSPTSRRPVPPPAVASTNARVNQVEADAAYENSLL